MLTRAVSLGGWIVACAVLAGPLTGCKKKSKGVSKAEQQAFQWKQAAEKDGRAKGPDEAFKERWALCKKLKDQAQGKTQEACATLPAAYFSHLLTWAKDAWVNGKHKTGPVCDEISEVAAAAGKDAEAKDLCADTGFGYRLAIDLQLIRKRQAKGGAEFEFPSTCETPYFGKYHEFKSPFMKAAVGEIKAYCFGARAKKLLEVTPGLPSCTEAAVELIKAVKAGYSDNRDLEPLLEPAIKKCEKPLARWKIAPAK